jgi:hypothetical protein
VTEVRQFREPDPLCYALSAFPDRRITRLMDYQEALASSAIEPGVAPLVAALNDDGHKTIASCEGHGASRRFFRRSFMEQHPFVLFHADVAWARQLAESLTHGHGRHNELHFVWRLNGYFYPGTWQLVWVIEPEDVRLPDEWDRDVLNQDLRVLATFARKIA